MSGVLFMPLTFEAVPPPLRVDECGSVRVGKTRVLLVLVIQAYLQGESPEGIVDMFDTLDLADVHATIAYYLRHKAEVDAYIADYERDAEAVRKKIEERQGPTDMRERLLKRQEEMRAKQAVQPA
jgi:uncharacterized protein (DUF433 family)